MSCSSIRVQNLGQRQCTDTSCDVLHSTCFTLYSNDDHDHQLTSSGCSDQIISVDKDGENSPVVNVPAMPTATIAGSVGSMNAVAASEPASTTAAVSHQEGRPDWELGGRSNAAVSPARNRAYCLSESGARGIMGQLRGWVIAPVAGFNIMLNQTYKRCSV